MSKIKITKAGREALKAALAPHCMKAAEEIADASNRESSWGFYRADALGNGAVVAALTHEANADNARAQRLLRALGGMSHG